MWLSSHTNETCHSAGTPAASQAHATMSTFPSEHLQQGSWVRKTSADLQIMKSVPLHRRFNEANHRFNEGNH